MPKKRKQYLQESLSAALEAVKKGMPVRKAEEKARKAEENERKRKEKKTKDCRELEDGQLQCKQTFLLKTGNCL